METQNSKRTPPKWYLRARSFLGKTEFMSDFAAYMVSWWPKVGLPGLKTIATSWSAWCALFIGMVLGSTGYQFQKSGLAKSYNGFGQKIEWKTKGIPQGAIIHIQHPSGGNHVTLANGDCAPKDLLKAGATFDGLGGNQSNTVKISTYSVTEIRYVGWPKEEELPPAITESVNCTSAKSAGKESTR